MGPGGSLGLALPPKEQQTGSKTKRGKACTGVKKPRYALWQWWLTKYSNTAPTLPARMGHGGAWTALRTKHQA